MICGKWLFQVKDTDEIQRTPRENTYFLKKIPSSYFADGSPKSSYLSPPLENVLQKSLDTTDRFFNFLTENGHYSELGGAMVAFGLCLEVHLRCKRKISQTSYASHPIAAAGIVLQFGGSLRALAITLLHDTVEEGGESALRLLRNSLSPDICEAVVSMTPSDCPGLPWRERKQCSLEMMGKAATADSDLAIAFMADKSATLGELLNDLSRLGASDVLSKLGRRETDLVWYYAACARTLAPHLNPDVTRHLEFQVGELRKLLQPKARPANACSIPVAEAAV